MTQRKLTLFITVLVAVIVPLLALSAVTVTPTGVAEACNPCECENDQRANCQGAEDYAIYTRVVDDACRIDAYLIGADGQGRRVFRATAAELAELPETPETNMEVETYRGLITLYKLTSGQYQVNYGPNREGKIFELIFSGCPAEDRTERTYIP